MNLQCCCSPVICNYLDTCLMYDAGLLSPHYPVPAIRERDWYEVMIEWYSIQYPK